MKTISCIALLAVLLVGSGCQSAQARLRAKQHQEQLQDSLFKAIEAKDAKRLTQLISEGVNVNPVEPGDYAPLRHAVYRNNTEITRLLVEAGADVNVRYAEPESVKEFTGIAFDFYRDGETALHWAARYDQVEIVKILLENGADANVAAWNSNTPLHEAARTHNDRVVKQLLDRGADPCARGAEGMTSLHMALSSDLFIDPDGSSARTVRLLLSQGVPIDTKDSKGMTPLHRIAGSYGGTYFAELLIERGASINAVDSEGRTPLDLAEDRDMRQFLQELDAKTSEELQEKDK